MRFILATACYENINENVIEDDEEEVTPEEFIALHEIFIGLIPEGETLRLDFHPQGSLEVDWFRV